MVDLPGYEEPKEPPLTAALSGADPLAHRPWELPRRPWVMAMRWSDLLFLHWPLDPDALRSWIPPGLELDTFDGAAWLGVVPFRMSGVRPRCVPPLPGLSSFAELNLRTYVTTGGKPGVWFFSLDAASRFAVRAARRFFHLPYYDADMRLSHTGETIRYESERRHRDASQARFVGSYGPTGSVCRSTTGSIDAWLTERYCLYAADGEQQIYRGEIHHEPWPLQPAEADVQTNTLAEELGVSLPTEKPLLHFSRTLDVVAWSLERV
jgi:uncharacterized protein YqjF (DUF2071 family)